MNKTLILGIFLVVVIIGWAGIGYYCARAINEKVFRDQPNIRKVSCDNNQYLVFALGFAYDNRLVLNGSPKVNQPVLKPGKSNEELADFLFANRHYFSAILTQRAISDVWLLNKKMTYPKENPTEADYGVLTGSSTRVYQMHKDDPQIAVRTFEALRCALNRLDDAGKKEIVLVAHDAHYQRAFFDLNLMHPQAKIINPEIPDISYPESRGPMSWSIREFFLARPYDVYNSRTLPCKCRAAVTLPPLQFW